MIFETDDGRVIAVAVRGGYDINEDKLRKIVKCKALKLASREVVKKITGAEVGYAGILNLPKKLKYFLMNPSIIASILNVEPIRQITIQSM